MQISNRFNSSTFKETFTYLKKLNLKFLSSDPSLPANALGNNSAKLDWPKVKPFGAPLEFVELNAEMVVHTDGLWEDVFTFWTCLRCDFPQFDIMRANGAPPPVH